MYAKIFLLVLTISALWYLVMILIFTFGWYRMKIFETSKRNFKTRVSVVVAYRNEENHMAHLLESLSKQSYPTENWDLILVDDHSEDAGSEKIKRFIDSHSDLSVKRIESDGIGKKAALLKGIQQADGSLIVTTDADCRVHPNWLVTMVSFYEQEHPLLIMGPVVYEEEKSSWQRLFSLDFMSLVASGAGSSAMNLPLMGNGANLAFERNIFLEAGAEAQKQHYASGDDVFLIHYLSAKYGSRAVRFIKNKESLVHTPAPRNVQAFMQQRIRWGSKAKAYEAFWPLMVAVSVFLFNALLVVSFFVNFFVPWFVAIYLVFSLLKFFIDLPLLQAFAYFSNKRPLLIYLLPFEFIYPLYILYAALNAMFNSYEWKGRSSLQ